MVVSFGLLPGLVGAHWALLSVVVVVVVNVVGDCMVEREMLLVGALLALMGGRLSEFGICIAGIPHDL